MKFKEIGHGGLLQGVRGAAAPRSWRILKKNLGRSRENIKN
ncbi:MAG: hypothetical protein FD143_3135 [Ignavibacteria bacterium]|nr:MAG: hypothetical protein FD143_3135 [Ignavibacteria bacterium]